MGFDWRKTLSTVAPLIGGALGGPMGATAAKIATAALGLEDSADPEQALAEAVSSGNPDILLKLREADNTFKLEMERIGVDLEEIYAADRKSARKLAMSTGLLTQQLLSGLFVVGYFAVFYVLLQQFFGGLTLHAEALSIISLLLGVMTGAVKDILQFWFGSSPREQTGTK